MEHTECKQPEDYVVCPKCDGRGRYLPPGSPHRYFKCFVCLGQGFLPKSELEKLRADGWKV
jgi:hypothetical protein